MIKLRLIFKTLIFENFRGPHLTQFSKFNNFLWACGFLCKNLSNFVPLPWKLHNPYCHTKQEQRWLWSNFLSTKGLSISDRNTRLLKKGFSVSWGLKRCALRQLIERLPVYFSNLKAAREWQTFMYFYFHQSLINKSYSQLALEDWITQTQIVPWNTWATSTCV